MWSNCLYLPFCSELHCLPISYLTFYRKRHLFREAIRSRVLVGFTMNSAKALSTMLGIHSRWMNQFGNCQNVGFWEGKDKWRPNAFISKRKKEENEKPQSWKKNRKSFSRCPGRAEGDTIAPHASFGGEEQTRERLYIIIDNHVSGDKQQSKARRCRSLAPFQFSPGTSGGTGDLVGRLPPKELFSASQAWPLELFWFHFSYPGVRVGKMEAL